MGEIYCRQIFTKKGTNLTFNITDYVTFSGNEMSTIKLQERQGLHIFSIVMYILEKSAKNCAPLQTISRIHSFISLLP